MVRVERIRDLAWAIFGLLLQLGWANEKSLVGLDLGYSGT